MTTKATAPRKSRILKLIGIICGALLLLLVVLYFVATSAAFFKGVILPRVSETAHATITVDDAHLSPFSSVTLEGLKVRTTGPEPLLTAREVVARYSLMDILGGHINVDEVSIADPVVHVIVDANGKSNLDPLMQTPTTPAEKPKPSGPMQVNIKKLALNNAQITYLQYQKNHTQTYFELPDLNFTLTDVRNGGTAKLSATSRLRFASGVVTNLDELTGKLTAAFEAALAPDLTLSQAKGNADLAVTGASGAFADANRLDSKFLVNLTMTNIQQIALDFAQGDQALGSIQVSGPFDMKTREGQLKLTVSGIGHRALSLVGGRFGMSFGDTQLAADAQIDIRNNAQLVSTTGTFTGSKFSLTRNDATTPTLDIRLAYDVTVDLPKTNATVRQFTLAATQNGQPLLDAGLSQPMVLNWSQGAQAAAESSLRAVITNFNLADWKAFLGPNVSQGQLNGELAVQAQQAGQLLGFGLSANLANLTAQFGSNRLDRAGLDLATSGQITNFNLIHLAHLDLNVSHAGEPVASLKGAGELNAHTRDADLQTELHASLATASTLLGRPDLALTSGTAAFQGHVTQKNRTPNQANNPSMDQTVVGMLLVTNLTGRFSSNQFNQFAAGANLDVGVKNNLAQINKCAGALEQAGQPGGRFEMTGQYNLTNQAGELAFKLTDLNQNVLRSFVAASLAPMNSRPSRSMPTPRPATTRRPRPECKARSRWWIC